VRQRSGCRYPSIGNAKLYQRGLVSLQKIIPEYSVRLQTIDEKMTQGCKALGYDTTHPGMATG